MKDCYIDDIKEMCRVLYASKTNIDYECNDYMEEWNFDNWGIKYWSKTKEFIDYLENVKLYDIDCE